VNPWPFVLGAYAIALLGTLVLTGWSWTAMRRAEAEAKRVSGRP